MPLEVQLSDLVRLGLVDAFEAEHEDPKRIAKRLEKARLIDRLQPQAPAVHAGAARRWRLPVPGRQRPGCARCTTNAPRPAACTRRRKAPSRAGAPTAARHSGRGNPAAGALRQTIGPPPERARHVHPRTLRRITPGRVAASCAPIRWPCCARRPAGWTPTTCPFFSTPTAARTAAFDRPCGAPIRCGRAWRPTARCWWCFAAPRAMFAQLVPEQTRDAPRRAHLELRGRARPRHAHHP